MSHSAAQTDELSRADLQYFVRAGRRYVRPYHYHFETHTKGRWVGRTLLHVFQQEFPYQPQHYFPRAIAAGRLFARRRNGQLVPATAALQQGDKITHIVHRHEPSVIEPALRVLQSDGDVVVVCKGSLPVHASGRYRRNTVVAILDACCGITEVYPVHRLDRVTTGIVLLARTRQMAKHLTDLIQTDNVRKEYLAQVVGVFPNAIRCAAPLAIDHNTRKSVVDTQSGKAAATRFTLLFTDGHTSLVHARPQTGRTHQIRVHLQHLGYPIVDDPIYHCSNSNKKRARLEVGLDFPLDGASTAPKRLRPLGGAVDALVGVGAAIAGAVAAAPLPEECSSPLPLRISCEKWTDTGLDEVCAHCPSVEPVGDVTHETTGDKVDTICLHALAYSCAEWCYVTPANCLPDWASSLSEDCLARLHSDRQDDAVQRSQMSRLASCDDAE